MPTAENLFQDKADRFLKVVCSRMETPGTTDLAGCDRDYSRADCSIYYTTAYRPTQGPAPRGPLVTAQLAERISAAQAGLHHLYIGMRRFARV